MPVTESGDIAMSMQKVEFQFITGLKRAIFRNPRLRGSWDSNGRYSDRLDGISDARGNRGRRVSDL